MLALDESRVDTHWKPIEDVTGKDEHLLAVHKKVADEVEELVVANQFGLLDMMIVEQLADLKVVVFDEAEKQVSSFRPDLEVP